MKDMKAMKNMKISDDALENVVGGVQRSIEEDAAIRVAPGHAGDVMSWIPPQRNAGDVMSWIPPQ